MQLDERDDVSRDESAVAEDEDGGSWSSGLETSVSSAHSRSIKGKERPAGDHSIISYVHFNILTTFPTL